jgi:hypothetical protein
MSGCVTHQGSREKEGLQKLFRQFECDVSEDRRPATLAIYFLRVNQQAAYQFIFQTGLDLFV